MAINYVYKLAAEFSQTVTGIKNSLKQTMNIVLVCLRELLYSYTIFMLYYIANARLFQESDTF